MNFKKLIIVFLILGLFFLLGFLSGVKKSFPYNEMKTFKEYIDNRSLDSSLLEKCSIPELDILPKKFAVVIGHAYGSAVYKNDFISKNIESFLLTHNKKLTNIFFTGDIFDIPSIEKWNKLFKILNNPQVNIAPGNHDISRVDSRYIFYNSLAYKKPFPYPVKYNQQNILVDDSVSSNWRVSDKLIKEINNENVPLYIMRHNPPVIELSRYTNSNVGLKKLDKLHQFERKITNSSDITWIMGDGGAFEFMPRLLCKRYKNHRFIINGLGGLHNDKILIIYENNIFSYKL